MLLRFYAAALLLAAAGCAMGPPPAPTPAPNAVVPAQTTPPPLNPAYRGVPGFDTRAYPGDAVMQAWLAASPYRWVGYYLPAPCHTDATWVGTRAALERMGWGTAVIFTGEQDWGAAATVSGPSTAAAAQSPRCTRGNLTAERGSADAAAADSAADAEGFPVGSTIYLDVERVDSVSTPLATYVRAWIGALLAGGRFRPGLYAHVRNADSLRAIQQAELARRGLAGSGRFWVAGSAATTTGTPAPSAAQAPAAPAPGTPAAATSPAPGAFDLSAAPAESGLPYATIWQGAHDARQSWAGTTLRIDVDVASSRSPSAPD